MKPLKVGEVINKGSLIKDGEYVATIKAAEEKTASNGACTMINVCFSVEIAPGYTRNVYENYIVEHAKAEVAEIGMTWIARIGKALNIEEVVDPDVQFTGKKVMVHVMPKKNADGDMVNRIVSVKAYATDEAEGIEFVSEPPFDEEESSNVPF